MVSKPSRPLTRRALSVAMAVLCVLTLAVRPASAAPGDSTAPPDEGTANMTLGQVLEKANGEWIEAQAALESSVKRQKELQDRLEAIKKELEPLTAEVNVLAAASYRAGGLRSTSALIASGSPETFMDRAILVNTITRYNDRQLNRLNKLQSESDASKKQIDEEVKQQRAQADIMGKRKKDAETALAKAGGRANGYVSASSPLAKPAPRNPDGSWPKEGCIIDDPTTTGCSTPRLIHAAKEARAAGFTRFYSCFRPGGPYEHPKGRACDFAAQPNGFGGHATGGDKTYGGNLAAFFVRNATALGVLYVIWYRQIWTPAAGWHYYSGAGGDPSSDHTNHVHLSVY